MVADADLDTTGPELESAAVPAPGDEVVLTFDEDLDISASDLPPASAFTVEADGAAVTVDGVSSDMHDTLVLSVAETIGQDATVTVSYAVPGSGKVIEDASGNDAAAFTDVAVTNNSIAGDTTAPALESAEVPATGLTLTLTFDENLDISATDVPAADAFTVTVDGTATTPDAVAPGADLHELVLTLPTAIERGQTVTVSYAVPGSGTVIADGDGNATEAFTDEPVTNDSTVDTTGPVLDSAELDTTGLVLTLVFDEDLDITASDLPPKSAFTVEADGVAVTVENIVSVVGQFDKLQLLIASVIERDQTVTVSYAVPTSGKIIEDTAGNDALAFTDFAVTNNSTADTTGPKPASGVADSTGTTVTIVFNEELDITSSDLPPASAFTVKADGFEVAVNGINGSSSVPNQLELPLSGTVYENQTVTVSYAKPAPGEKVIADTLGNESASFNDFEVTNESTVEKPTPVLTQTLAKPRVFGSPPPAKSTTVLHVQWRLPLAPFEPAWVGGFDVRYRKKGTSDWPEVPEECDETAQGTPNATKGLVQGVTKLETTLEGLDPGTRYKVEVRMKNARGCSPWSDTGNGRTRTPGNPYTGDLRFAPGTKSTEDSDSDGEDEDKGRLQVYRASTWGTVCNDRFKRAVTGGAPNVAPRLACRIMGYADGVYAGGFGRYTGEVDEDGNPVPVEPSRQDPIWLDDLYCHEGSTHWTGLPPTKLEHCHHAGGWGLHNCKHSEDAGVRCWGELGEGENVWDAPGETSVPQGQALTGEFTNVPEAHIGAGATFTLQLAFSEPVANTADDLKDHAIEVTGGTVQNVAAVPGRTDLWDLTVAPDGDGDVTVEVEAGGTCGDDGVICTDTGNVLSAPASKTIAGPGVPALTVTFGNGPASHDGSARFTVDLVFSAAPHERGNQDILAALEVNGATKIKMRRVDKDNAHRRVTVEPTGDGTVTLSFPATADCTATTALCTAEGGKLKEKSFEIAGPQARVRSPTPAALTAHFDNPPKEHEGKRLDLFIVFSAEPQGGEDAVHGSLDVQGGAKRNVKVMNDEATRFRARTLPEGFGPMTVTLAATTDCADVNALCTAGGARLESPPTVTILGPVAISVADARVEEADGAQLAFAVTLDRARHATVTVDYETEDGTAKVDENDYVATSGTLTFAAGETSKTVEVEVLDDAYDEGEETMALRLSNPVGAWIADGEAVGTIENTDPMPRAWLSRFGRTVADQVLDAVEGRMRAPRTAGAQASLAGQRLGLGPLFGVDAAPEGGEEAAALRARESEAEAAEAGRRLAAWLAGESEAERSGPETRTATPRELLLGSSFSLSAGTVDAPGGSASLWGGAAVSRFDGREGELVLDGEVASGLLGADWARGRWTAGLIVSHSRGEGGWRGEAGSGTVSSTLTGLYPWGRHALTERVSVWSVAGWGEGTLTLTPEGPDGESLAAIRTDLDLAMGAVGVRGTVVEAPPEGGVELSVTGDALGVRTTSAKVRGLAASEAGVTRLRLGLEGTWRGLAVGTGTLEPRLELGARHDGGDAETGFGLDVGGGLAWSDPGRGTSAELRGRGLLTHESAGFGDRGFAGSLAFDPAPGSDRGPSLTLSQTVGAQASGGMDALLRPETARALGAADEDDLSRRRLEARLGYGFAVFGGGWTGTPELGLGWSEAVRETTVRWRLAEVRSAGLVFGLDVEGARREGVSGGAAPEHRLGLGFGWRLAGAGPGSFEVRFEGARHELGDGTPDHEVGLRLRARW